MISLILFSIAAILNSFMDKWMQKYQLLPDKLKDQINPNWFSYNPLAKWKDGDRTQGRAFNFILLKLGIKTKWLTDNSNDGWHTFKSLMIVCLALSAILFNPQLLFQGYWYNYIGILLIYGIAWNLPFNIFYNKTKI